MSRRPSFVLVIGPKSKHKYSLLAFLDVGGLDGAHHIAVCQLAKGSSASTRHLSCRRFDLQRSEATAAARSRTQPAKTQKPVLGTLGVASGIGSICGVQKWCAASHRVTPDASRVKESIWGYCTVWVGILLSTGTYVWGDSCPSGRQCDPWNEPGRAARVHVTPPRGCEWWRPAGGSQEWLTATLTPPPHRRWRFRAPIGSL